MSANINEIVKSVNNISECLGFLVEHKSGRVTQQEITKNCVRIDEVFDKMITDVANNDELYFGEEALDELVKAKELLVECHTIFTMVSPTTGEIVDSLVMTARSHLILCTKRIEYRSHR